MAVSYQFVVSGILAGMLPGARVKLQAIEEAKRLGRHEIAALLEEVPTQPGESLVERLRAQLELEPKVKHPSIVELAGLGQA